MGKRDWSYLFPVILLRPYVAQDVLHFLPKKKKKKEKEKEKKGDSKGSLW